MPSSILDIIIGYIVYIQQKIIITKERFHSISQYFFRSIGFLTLLYFFLQLPMLLYGFLKLLFRIVFQIFMIIFWLPLKTIELFLPRTKTYYIIFPLFCLCSFLSFLIAKFSYKNSGKRRSFNLTFIILFLLQSLFILLPIATSIQEQQKLSTIPVDIEQTMMKLSEITEHGNSKREESTANNNEVKISLGQHSNFESYVENEPDVTLRSLQVSSNEEQKNNFIGSSQQFSSNVLDNSSDFIQAKAKQIEEIGQRIQSFIKSITISQNWLHNPWNIWHKTKLFFSLSKKSLSQYDVSSIYTAFIDLHCYDYTKSLYRYKQKYIYFLNTYRRQSPFLIYLSVIKSNGPVCYSNYPNSFCAIRSNLKRQLFRFIRFWLIITLPIIILIVIYKHLRSKQQFNRSLKKANDLPPEKISPTIKNNNHPLDKTIENKLSLWLKQEKNNGYQNISQSCRLALNRTFTKQYEQLTIETLQFADAKIYNITQASGEIIIIDAMLDIDHLILNVIKDQPFSIRILKLTGELGILLNNNTIEVKFKQIHIDDAQIIDPKTILSSDEKESIMKLVKDVIQQTIVQCCFYLSDNQEKTQPSVPPVLSQPSNIDQEFETPIIMPVTNNHHHEQIIPEKEVKQLLVRIVKAVKLHDVEQPFCIIELNQPKQIHQTSIAKNGLNPFWDEHFLFQCNDKSNQIHLQLIDRKKPNKKFHSNNLDIVYADISIPFSYVTSTIYKQDVRITPQHPDSIIRIEFSTLTDEETISTTNGYNIENSADSPSCLNNAQETKQIEYDHRQSPSDEILTVVSNNDVSSKDYNTRIYPSLRSQPTTTDAFSTLSPLTSPDDGIQLDKPRKSRSFMNSFRLFSRRKKREKKGKENENGLNSPFNTPTQTNSISHSLSAEPFLSPNITPFRRDNSISRSFRNFFRSNSKKQNLTVTNNFIIDHPDLLTTSTPTPKKRSFFRRFKSKRKQEITLSINSLTSDDCTRRESVRNTPIRANVGRPVTMTKPLVT